VGKKIFIALVSLLSLMVIAFVAMVLMSGGEVRNEGPLVRRVEKGLVRVGQPISVTLAISPKPLTEFQAVINKRPMDIVLICDRSGSMAGLPVQQGIEAASNFVETVDLKRHRVAALLFNDSISRFQPLVDEKEPLKGALQRVEGTGGTDIGLALRAAHQELSGRGRPDAKGVIILFSDGGANEPSDAVKAADAAKRVGIRIITVGLAGYDFNESLLREMASSPSDYVVAKDALSLGGLYANLACEINEALATDVVIVEKYNAEGFDLVTDSLSPPAQTEGGAIVWKLGVISDEGRKLSYRLRARRWGWHSLCYPGEISMIDPHNKPLQWISPPGPKVFVYPALWWLLILPLIPFLVWFGYSHLKRPRRKPSEPIAFISKEKIPEKRYHPPSYQWISEAEYLKPREREKPSGFNPTLIIGVGEAGRWVLTYIKKEFYDRFRGAFPEEVRLLLVDLKTSEHQPKEVILGEVSLDDSEVVILEPDFEDVDEALEERGEELEHLRWWRGNRADDYGRAGGRMAIFYDLRNGTTESKLWNKLTDRLESLLGKEPSIFVVSSLSHPLESGMVLDLAQLVRIVAKPHSLRSVIAFLALQNSFIADDTIDQSEMYQNTFAALRELQRLTFKKAHFFEYNPNFRELIVFTSSTPVDRCFLFDGLGEAMNLLEIKSKEGVLAAMADCLITIIDPGVGDRFWELLRRNGPRLGEVQSRTGECIIGSMGSFVYWLPVEDLRRAVEHRLLLELFFGKDNPDDRVGIVRVKEAREGSLELVRRTDFEDPSEAVLSFLRGINLRNHHPLARELADAVKRGSWDKDQAAESIEFQKEIFLWSLQEKLTAILNGEDRREDHWLKRSGKLLYAIDFLREVETILEKGKRLAEAEAYTFQNEDVVKGLTTFLDVWQRKTREARAEIEAWVEVLVGKSGAGRKPKFRHGIAQGKTPRTLYQLLKEGWLTSRWVLEEARQVKVRRTLLDEKLEEPFYHRYIGVKEKDRVAVRIGWLWELQDDQLRLKLLVLPPGFRGEVDDFKGLTRGAQQIVEIKDSLLCLAESFSRSICDAAITKDQIHIRDLIQGSYPLISYNETLASEIVPAKSYRLLISRDRTLCREIAEQLKTALNADVDWCTIDDPSKCAILGIRDLVPLNTLDAYQEAKAGYYPVRISHVFPAEQTAVEFERRLRGIGEPRRTLHPLFVRLLEKKELAEMFGRCCIYGLVRWKIEEDGKRFIITEIQPPLDQILERGVSLWNAMEAFTFDMPFENMASPYHPLGLARLKGTVEQIERALMEKAKDLGDSRFQYLEDFERQIQPLRESDLPWERDLGAFLKVLVEEEKLR